MKYRLRTHDVEAIQWNGRARAFSEIENLAYPNEVSRHLDTVEIMRQNRDKLRLFMGDFLVFRDGSLAVYNGRVFRDLYEEVK